MGTPACQPWHFVLFWEACYEQTRAKRGFLRVTGCDEKIFTLWFYIVFLVLWMAQSCAIRRLNGNFTRIQNMSTGFGSNKKWMLQRHLINTRQKLLRRTCKFRVFRGQYGHLKSHKGLFSHKYQIKIAFLTWDRPMALRPQTGQSMTSRPEDSLKSKIPLQYERACLIRAQGEYFVSGTTMKVWTLVFLVILSVGTSVEDQMRPTLWILVKNWLFFSCFTKITDSLLSYGLYLSYSLKVGIFSYFISTYKCCGPN